MFAQISTFFTNRDKPGGIAKACNESHLRPSLAENVMSFVDCMVALR